MLDSTYYLATGLRRPKVLGWNCIEAGSYATHPSPDPIYYPAHPDAVSCWNSNTNIMWLGTGRPANNTCSNIASTFSDVKISLAKDNCDAGEVGCYKILRQWSMVDWCSGSVREYSQIIKVMDTLGLKSYILILFQSVQTFGNVKANGLFPHLGLKMIVLSLQAILYAYLLEQ